MVDIENVELAFVEKVEHFRLYSCQFPSKLGGKPAWLSLSNLPSNKDLECNKCGKILSFLLQIYCPVETNPKAFHRTLFVFICRNVSCYSKNSNINFCVFRCQLSRINEYYSSEPPDDGAEGPSAQSYQDLCRVCGLRGPKRCSQCHSVTYCSKDHQQVDWKNGHKVVCKKGYSGSESEKADFYPGVNFPEFELVIEPEVLSSATEKKKSDEEKMQEYKEFMKSKEAESLLPDSTAKELEKMAASDNSQDKVFLKFKDRIKDEPDQVLRYQRNGQPLWVSRENIPTDADIPYCSCGAPRHFEFQIMPQLLTYMEVDSLGDSIDWGTLCVYTCSASCDIGNEYRKEFIWKQDFSDTNL